MSNRLTKPIGRFSLLAAVFVCLFTADRLPAQMADLNANGMSDIWEAIFGASGLDPNADTDGDGVVNRLESIAGTNPFDSNSVPRIAQSVYSLTNFSVSLASVLGKSYQLQSSPTVPNDSWSNEVSIVARTGTFVTLTAPVNAAGKFFRILISDVDTDGDGLSDWEELQIGTDPTRANSNGQLDGDGQPLSDFRYATNRLANQNVVTLTSLNPTATVPDVDPAADTGMFSLTRGGFPLNAVTVQLGVSGTAAEGVDYVALPRPVTFPIGVSTVYSPVTPLASSPLKSGQPVTMTVQPGAGYTIGTPGSASVVISPTITPTGTGLTGKYYNGVNTNNYFNVTNFNSTNLIVTRVDGPIDFNWTNGVPAPGVNTNFFCVRWTGQVQPQFSEPYNFVMQSDEGGKLWVNGQLLIDKWFLGGTGTVRTGSITLQGGVRYDIQLDYFDATGAAECHLLWNSPNQPQQVIPMNRLYPSGAPAPANIVSPATAFGFVGQPFSYTIAGSNPGTNPPARYGASPLPLGLSFTNSTNGIIAGIPAIPGEFQIVITVTNTVGIGSSLLDLIVFDTGSMITREVWTGVPGTNVASIPVDTAPSLTSGLTNLAGITDYGDDYGERIRGYLTAPLTGNYYFWIAAGDSAELWISNDSEPVNRVRRAYVINGTSPLVWTSEPNQKSPWLALVAGQRYYIEVLHKAGTGPGDNVAVGWLRPDQAGTAPSQIVPGFVLSPYVAPSGPPPFTPPPYLAPWPGCPGCVDDHASTNAASRFLIQATFGPSQADIDLVRSIGYEAWIDAQFTNGVTHHLPYVLANASSDPTTPYPSSLTFNSWWQQSITAPDQLRQRVAFALSEIMVVSDVGTLNNNGRILSDYYDTLLDNAFARFRDIIETVTLTPAMGLYLDMRANDKGNQVTGFHPNENYAREIMQLFSVGLYRMWPDGSLVTNSLGAIVPTYDQTVIVGYAQTFTGWNYHQTNQANGRAPTGFSPGANYTDPMTLVPSHHELGAKRLLDNIIAPQAIGNQADSTKVEYDSYGLQDLKSALDAIADNQNVGPFICRELIQRLVTSNPSRGYLYRVVQKFNDNGAGVRGDMKAVIKAILLDYEARSSVVAGQSTYGKQREPVLRVTAPARAFPATPIDATYTETNSRTITVTTPGAHRLATGDTLELQFNSENSGQPLPTSTAYTVGSTPTTTTFTITAGGLSSGSYTQSVSTTTTTNTDNMTFTNIVTVTNSSTITVFFSSHTLVAGNQLYLDFTSGGASNGAYQVANVLDASHFTIMPSDFVNRTGSCVIPKTVGGFTQSRSNITVSTTGNHSLSVNDSVYIVFPSGTASNGAYQVVTAPDATHFTVMAGVSASFSATGVTNYPLVMPPLNRAGSVTVLSSTWNLTTTDNDLFQTPLRSPTVFNFYFPDFQFPGILTSAGLVAPEFQLSSDTGVANQMNFLYNATLGTGGGNGNANGFSSFRSGSGAIVLDLGPWMTTVKTSNSGIPGLVDELSTLLLGGQLATSVRTTIVNYVANNTNFPYTTPTNTQMRDRVRAIVHLLLTSPDFTIQR